MDPISAYHAVTDAAVRLAGGCDKLVHVNVGLAIYVGAQLLLPTRRASGRALLLVALVEIVNEGMDRLFWGAWRWPDTIGDIAATLFWPAVLVLLGKLRRRRWALEWRSVRAPLAGPAPAECGRRRAPDQPLAAFPKASR